jgi:peptidyl-prolyl cis-trans isomerase B (cyclophilin B)
MIRLPALRLALLAIVPLSPLGCPPSELPPTEELLPTERTTLPTTADAPATATVDQVVELQAHVQALADSGTIYYDWLQTAGLGVPIAGADAATASFIAPSLPAAQTLRFMVTTRDDAGAVGAADVAIMVSADSNFGHPASQPSQSVAEAGPDQWALAGEQVNLDGSKSSGAGLTFHWRRVSGGSVTFTTPDEVRTTFAAPPFEPNDTNIVLIELTVTDANGRQVTDRTQVKVGDPTLSDHRVQVQTSKGTIVLDLDRAKAPVTVGNFMWYIDDAFYDGTIFHRVIADFVIQGGGYLPDLVEKKPRASIINEASNGLSNVRGTIAMARSNDPNSATSQFYINVKDNIKDGDGKSDLDPGGVTPEGYAVFGHVTAGLDVVDEIAAVPTHTSSGFQDVPEDDVTILRVTRLPATVP